MSIKLRLLLFRSYLRSKLRAAVLKFGVFARATKLRSCLWWKLKYQLRLLDDAACSEGFDPNFDKVVHLTALRLAVPDAFDENLHTLLSDDPFPILTPPDESKRLQLDYEQNKDVVDQLIAGQRGAAAIRTTLGRYFQVVSFIQNHLGNKKGQEYYANSARSYDPEVSVPDVKTFRAQIHETRREIKNLKASISDRETFKISLSSQNPTAVLTVLSALFLVSGYLYSRAFLGHFGVEVAKYFSLSDYVAASINGIRYAVVAAIMGSLGCFLGVHSLSRMSYAEAVQTSSERRIYASLVTATFCVGAVTAYVQDSETFYGIAALFIFLLSLRPVSWLIRRYFEEKDGILAFVLVLLVLTFSLHLFASVRRDIHRIEHAEASALKQYDISFKGPVAFNTETTVLLAANSGYLFLRDTASGKVYIIPRDQVQNISVRNEGELLSKVVFCRLTQAAA